MPSRLETLQKKLKAREGQSGFKKNCEAIKLEIARLQSVPPPSPEQMETEWMIAEHARKSEQMTTSPSKQDAPSVASTVNKDQSGE